MTPSQSVNRKRFYKAAGVAGHEGGGFDVQLDGHPIRTPAGRSLTLPTRALAEAIAREWDAQGETVAPASLPLTRLANSAIDGVAGREKAVTADILKFAAADLLCYRASFPAGLAAGQARLWNPILTWVEGKYRAPFLTGTGVKHVAQPAASLDAIRRALSSLDSFKLAALHVMTSLTGSALIALAHTGGFLDAKTAWSAAHADEDWQTSQWGADSEAAVRRANGFAEFENASRLYSLS